MLCHFASLCLPEDFTTAAVNNESWGKARALQLTDASSAVLGSANTVGQQAAFNNIVRLPCEILGYRRIGGSSSSSFAYSRACMLCMSPVSRSDGSPANISDLATADTGRCS